MHNSKAQHWLHGVHTLLFSHFLITKLQYSSISHTDVLRRVFSYQGVWLSLLILLEEGKIIQLELVCLLGFIPESLLCDTGRFIVKTGVAVLDL